MSTWASLFDEPGIPSELAPRVWGNPVILRTICQFSSTEALLRMGRVDSDGLTEATKQTWGMKRKVDKIEKTLNKVGENNPRHELYRNAIRHIHVGRNPKTTFQQYMLRFPNLRSLVVEHKGKDKSYSFASLSYAWTKTLEGKYTATCQFDSLEGTNTAAHLAFARDYLPTGWEATYTIEDAFILDIEKIGKVRKMSLEVQHFTVWPELFTPGLPDALADMLQENQPRTVSVRCLHFGADGSMVMDEDCLATKIHTVDEAADVLARISNSAMLNRRGLLAGRANTFTNVAMLLLQATRHIRAFPIFDCSFELPDITDISAAAQLIIPASTYRVPYRSYAHRITFRLSDPQRGHVPPADYLVRLHQNRAWIRILARICMIVWGPGARYNVEIGSMSIESGTWFRKEAADDLRALRQILVDTSAAYNSMLNDAITMLDEMQPKEAPVIGWKRLTKD